MSIYAVYKLDTTELNIFGYKTFINADCFKNIKIDNKPIVPIGYLDIETLSLDDIDNRLEELNFKRILEYKCFHGKFTFEIDTFERKNKYDHNELLFLCPLETDNNFSYLKQNQFKINIVCGEYRITNTSNSTTICMSSEEFLKLKKEISFITT